MPRLIKTDILTHVLSRCVRSPSGCLLWQGSINNGYGHTQVKGRMKKVHRVVWEENHGPIPEGLLVCHTCDVRNCEDINHLFLGTDKDNVQDMMMKNRDAMRGTKNPHAKMTDEMVREIRNAEGTHRYLAAKYNVNVAQITRVKNKQIWKHVT